MYLNQTFLYFLFSYLYKKMVNFSFDTQVILVVGICLISSFFLNFLSRKLKLPLMIAPLIVGIALNLGLINYLSFLPSFHTILSIFANFGVVIVLFFIGLGVDLHFMKDLSRNSSIMALNAGHIPFFLGLFATYIYTRNWVESLFVGIALAITAEEVAVSILDELKLMHKRVGQLIIEAGIIGDVFEIMAIGILGLFVRTKTSASFTIFNLLFDFFMLILIVLVMRYYILEWLLTSIGRKGHKFEYFKVAFVTLLIMTIVSELLNFSHIIGALVAGILLKDKLIGDKMYYAEHHIVEALEVFNFGIFQPLIFIWIGLSVDLRLISQNLEFGIVLTILAIVGKLLGALIGNWFCHEPWREGILIGWGLNARGATELFALLIAQNQGLVSNNVFSAIVFMALVTTFISPIVFKILVLKGFGMYKHNHKNIYKR